MFTNDFGLNHGRASPLWRITKPASHLFETLMALSDSVFHGLEKGATALARWQRTRRTYAELAQLDDRLLRDIGLSRDSFGGRLVVRDETRRFELDRGARF